MNLSVKLACAPRCIDYFDFWTSHLMRTNCKHAIRSEGYETLLDPVTFRPKTLISVKIAKLFVSKVKVRIC